MKNKILIVGALALILAFAGNAYAVGQNSNSGTGTGSQVQQQTQISNQGEDSQIQTQNNEQAQSGAVNQAGIGTQMQQQAQQELQDGTGTGNQTQNQGQEAIQVAEQRRSQVANAVQEMLQVAERNGGIGQQVMMIAQNQNQEKIELSLQKVQSRSGFAKFFIGPNYGEINNAKKLLEQNREQIKQLNQIATQLSSQGDQQILTQQIQTLEQANLQIDNSLGTAQKGFSLLGWVFRLFSK
jgi:DNA-binding ferritin-like protein